MNDRHWPYLVILYVFLYLPISLRVFRPKCETTRNHHSWDMYQIHHWQCCTKQHNILPCFRMLIRLLKKCLFFYVKSVCIWTILNIHILTFQNAICFSEDISFIGFTPDVFFSPNRQSVSSSHLRRMPYSDEIFDDIKPPGSRWQTWQGSCWWWRWLR